MSDRFFTLLLISSVNRLWVNEDGMSKVKSVNYNILFFILDSSFTIICHVQVSVKKQMKATYETNFIY